MSRGRTGPDGAWMILMSKLIGAISTSATNKNEPVLEQRKDNFNQKRSQQMSRVSEPKIYQMSDPYDNYYDHSNLQISDEDTSPVKLVVSTKSRKKSRSKSQSKNKPIGDEAKSRSRSRNLDSKKPRDISTRSNSKSRSPSATRSRSRSKCSKGHQKTSSGCTVCNREQTSSKSSPFLQELLDQAKCISETEILREKSQENKRKSSKELSSRSKSIEDFKREQFTMFDKYLVSVPFCFLGYIFTHP
jgi:hypothetical protein